MKYEYKDNVYNYVGVGKFKDSTGKWIDAIIYERDNHMYMREITDFIDKFKKAWELAGAYNLGFFIELAEYFIFLYFFIF